MCCKSARRRRRNRSTRFPELRIPRLLIQTYLAPRIHSELQPVHHHGSRELFPRRPVLCQASRRAARSSKALNGTNPLLHRSRARRVRSLNNSHTRFLAMTINCRGATCKPNHKSPTPQCAVLSYSPHGQPPPVSHVTPRFGKGTRDVSTRPERPMSLTTPHNFTLACYERLPAKP